MRGAVNDNYTSRPVAIEELTGVRSRPGHVWRLLGALGFSCQQRRALARDESASRQWQRVQWRVIKEPRAGPPACAS